jgi:GrpB-like predicted nucleotidyltransferase (UPF0157 family)
MNKPIIVVESDPQWPEMFATVCRELRTALAGVPVVAIEHVGSTSVPGLAAKPIIDVDVIVRGSDVRSAVEALESSGYVLLGDLGVPDRIAFTAPVDSIRRNVYITIEGCLALRNHLGLRDVLRSDPHLRDQYSEIKRQLAAGTCDIDVYVAGKTDVIHRILERAGLTDGELEEIERINRG